MNFAILADPGGVMQDINVRMPKFAIPDEEVRLGLVAAARVYMRYLRERYLSASRGDGTWAPLAIFRPSVKLNPMGRRFSRLGVSTGILIKTGNLFDSMFEGGAGHIERVEGSTIIVGTAVPYALFHQFGTSRMPAREIFVPPDLSTLNEMRRLIKGGIKRATEQRLEDEREQIMREAGIGNMDRDSEFATGP